LNQLQCEKKAYEDEQEVTSFEKWWQSPTTTLEDRLQCDSKRALQEEIQGHDSFLRSCWVFPGHKYDLVRAAASLSLAYEAVHGPVDLPLGAEVQRCQIIGEVTTVAAHVKAFKEGAEKKALEQWDSWRTRMEAEQAAKRTQQHAFLDQAKAAEQATIYMQYPFLNPTQAFWDQTEAAEQTAKRTQHQASLNPSGALLDQTKAAEQTAKTHAASSISEPDQCATGLGSYGQMGHPLQ
jgi:hypothetical protein